jgi:para-nitrobenzyl esterase
MDPVVRTSSGQIRGLDQDGVGSFRGIPFAAPPDGPLRFRPPAPPESWDGIRDAVTFSAAPPQLPVAPGLPAIWQQGDSFDCLTVNVSTPAPGTAGLPVMVWIYGGGWKVGSASMPAYDATKLASSGVVVVTFNYRVGFEGFGQLPGIPANRGLLDQIAALHWVQRNIAGFGGDPGNVTIFGQSAGAASVGLLVAAPAAHGLFRRAIAQSIPSGYLTIGEAEHVTGLLAAEVGVPANWQGFAGLRPEAILEVQDVPLREAGAGVSVFGPVIDGDLVTGPPWMALRDGAGRDVDLICGFNHEEYRFFTAGSGSPTVDLEAVSTSLGLGPDATGAYRSAYPGSTDGDLFIEMMSDALFRMPTTWTAEAHAQTGGRTWLYDFNWRSPLLGACHTLDVPFVFDNAEAPTAARLLGSPPPAVFSLLSGYIRKAWTTFAATGDPGWPRFDPEVRHTRIWNTSPSNVTDPLIESRKIWTEVPLRDLAVTGHEAGLD